MSDAPEEPRDKPRTWPRYTREDLDVVRDEFGREHFFARDTGRPMCGRLKKKKNRGIPNEVCAAPPMPAGPCKVHGGKSAGPQTAGGRYSRALGKWRAGFERALADQDLLDVRRDIAMQDTIIEELLKRLGERDSPQWRRELAETFERLSAAIRSRRQSDIAPLLAQLGRLIEEGSKHDLAVRELVEQVDRRAERALKYNTLEVRKTERITVAEMAAIFALWVRTLEKHLEPPVFARLVPVLREITVAQRLPTGDEDPLVLATGNEAADDD